jgi:hypothetical protein
MVLATAATACSTSNSGSPTGAMDGSAAVDASDAGASNLTGPQGCAAGPDAGGGYSPMINPADFVAVVDNPYYPLVPGTVWKYKDTAGNDVAIEVYSETKTILGVPCVVVRDRVSSSAGMLTEDTWDWFTQDKSGNVWYFGEDTSKYGPGGWSKEGSWTGGEDCAKPGINMLAHPKVGDTYPQEFYAGHAEDRGDILSVTETVTTPYGTFHNCVETRDYSRLAPGMDEHKYYCAGVGLVVTQDLPDGVGTREELQSLTSPAGDSGSPQNDGAPSVEAGGGGSHDAQPDSATSTDAGDGGTPGPGDGGISDAGGDASHD